VAKFCSHPNYFHLSRLCPVWVGGGCQRLSSIRLLYLTFSWASSSLSEQDCKSFLIVFCNLCFGHPWLLFRLTFTSCTFLISSSFSLLYICPNHSNYFLLISFNTFVTFTSCFMVSLVLCSSTLIPRQ